MAKMKNSGVEWIGEIPEDWNIEKIGSLFYVRNEKVNDTDYEPLSVSKGGIVPQMENVAKTDANDNRKMVLKNDFVINSRSDRKQSCGVSPLDGSVSLINTVLYATENAPVHSPYLNYLLKNYGFAEEFYRWGHGIVADLWTTRWQEMKSISIPLPSVEKQRELVSAIESKTTKIDSLIANEEKQIEKLKSYKQSLITETVTKGLDKNAKMKDSGVEWIGEIPEGWNRVPLKTEFTFSKGLAITKADLVSEGLPVISYGQIHSKQNSGTYVKNSLLRFVPEKYSEDNESSLGQQGDIFFADTSEDYEGIGDFVLIDTSKDIYAGYHTILARPNRKFNAKYFSYLFLSDMWRSQLRSKACGIKVYSVTQTMLKKIDVIIPSETEQNKIVNFLDQKCKSIESLIILKESKIEKLNAYKKSLIYEYVTGKKDA